MLGFLVLTVAEFFFPIFENIYYIFRQENHFFFLLKAKKIYSIHVYMTCFEQFEIFLPPLLFTSFSTALGLPFTISTIKNSKQLHLECRDEKHTVYEQNKHYKKYN